MLGSGELRAAPRVQLDLGALSWIRCRQYSAPGGGCHLLFALKVLAQLSRVTDWTDALDWHEHIAFATYSAFVNRERHTTGLTDISEDLANELLDDANVSLIARNFY